MEDKKTRTGYFTGVIADNAYNAVSVFLTAVSSRMAKVRDFKDVRFQNLGDQTLWVANMSTGDPLPVDADAIPIAPGETVIFARVNTGEMYLRSENVAGPNKFSIKGDPL